ncbi:MAG: prolyl oligopeptidase family serine peptidase [Planctomycetota bacterium]
MITLLLFTLGVLSPSLIEDPPDAAERIAAFSRYPQVRQLAQKGILEPKWLGESDRLWWIEGAPDETVVFVVDAEAGKQEPLLDTKKVREQLEKHLGHEPPYQGLPFSELKSADETSVTFEVEGRTFRCLLESGRVSPAPSGEQSEREKPRKLRKGFTAGAPDIHEVPSPDGRWFLGDRDGDLYLRSTLDDREVVLTEDGAEELGWRVDDARWSPDSLSVVAGHIDLNGVARLPVVHWLKTTEDIEWAPYVKAGGRMPLSALDVFDVISGERHRLEGTGRPNRMLLRIGWSADGREFLFMSMERTYQHLELWAADRETGASRLVLEERSDTFIGALHFQTTWQGRYSPVGDDGRFLWLSERDGWFRPYLFDRAGKLLAVLTRGDFDVLAIEAVDVDRGFAYYTAHGEPHPYDAQLYRVRLDGRDQKKLTETMGEHRVAFSPSKRFFVDVHSTAARPPVTELRKSDGTPVRTLAEVDPKKLQEAGFVPPEEFVVKAQDGETDLYGLLFKPKDFDPAKRYPIIDYIYNGPFTTWVPRTFEDGRGVLAGGYAQAGFLVMMVDGRGTPGRGKAFQDVVYRAFGQNEIPDHAAALRQLAARHDFIDDERVGIFGGSWGGYMTIRAMVTHPDVYHVGVATNSVADLYDHAASPIEGYMGLPQEHPEDYERASSLRLADRLKGELLLIHGTSDVNATFSATMKMVAALIEAGKPHDLIVLPESDHWPRGKNQQYATLSQLRYFLEHLRPDRLPEVAAGSE